MLNDFFAEQEDGTEHETGPDLNLSLCDEQEEGEAVDGSLDLELDRYSLPNDSLQELENTFKSFALNPPSWAQEVHDKGEVVFLRRAYYLLLLFRRATGSINDISDVCTWMIFLIRQLVDMTRALSDDLREVKAEQHRVALSAALVAAGSGPLCLSCRQPLPADTAAPGSEGPNGLKVEESLVLPAPPPQQRTQQQWMKQLHECVFAFHCGCASVDDCMGLFDKLSPQSIEELEHSDASHSHRELAAGCGVLLMYIGNLIKHPSVPRYRRISSSNSSFRTALADLAGHELVLSAVGFVHRGSHFEWEWANLPPPLASSPTTTPQTMAKASVPTTLDDAESRSVSVDVGLTDLVTAEESAGTTRKACAKPGVRFDDLPAGGVRFDDLPAGVVSGTEEISRLGLSPPLSRPLENSPPSSNFSVTVPATATATVPTATIQGVESKVVTYEKLPGDAGVAQALLAEAVELLEALRSSRKAFLQLLLLKVGAIGGNGDKGQGQGQVQDGASSSVHIGISSATPTKNEPAADATGAIIIAAKDGAGDRGSCVPSMEGAGPLATTAPEHAKQLLGSPLTKVEHIYGGAGRSPVGAGEAGEADDASGDPSNPQLLVDQYNPLTAYDSAPATPSSAARRGAGGSLSGSTLSAGASSCTPQQAPTNGGGAYSMDGSLFAGESGAPHSSHSSCSPGEVTPSRAGATARPGSSSRYRGIGLNRTSSHSCSGRTAAGLSGLVATGSVDNETPSSAETAPKDSMEPSAAAGAGATSGSDPSGSSGVAAGARSTVLASTPGSTGPVTPMSFNEVRTVHTCCHTQATLYITPLLPIIVLFLFNASFCDNIMFICSDRLTFFLWVFCII